MRVPPIVPVGCIVLVFWLIYVEPRVLYIPFAFGLVFLLWLVLQVCFYTCMWLLGFWQCEGCGRWQGFWKEEKALIRSRRRTDGLIGEDICGGCKDCFEQSGGDYYKTKLGINSMYRD